MRKRENRIEHNRMESIIQQMGEGVIVINDNNEIEMMNRRAVEILGYRSFKDIPSGYRKFFVLELSKELAVSKEKIFKKELVIDRPRNAVIMVTLARLPQGDGGFVAVLRDITIERRVEKMKSDFVANVSHEIRSPMAPMKEALSLLLEGAAGPLNEQQRRFLDILNNNMGRLLRLINELLDLSKIEAGRMELKKGLADPAAMIKDVAEALQAYAEKKSIKLTLDLGAGGLNIVCDRDRVIQVMTNLVTNALKFTPEGGVVKVAARRRTEKSVEISVADTGPGISDKEIEVLFDRFRQLPSADKMAGAGLGLSISKAIVELHGGRIWVESKPGKGSTFKFILPV